MFKYIIEDNFFDQSDFTEIQSYFNNNQIKTLEKDKSIILEFNDDVIFELDLTPNRGDCLGHLGVARELAINNNLSISYRKIDFNESESSNDSDYTISIKDTVMHFKPALGHP